MKRLWVVLIMSLLVVALLGCSQSGKYTDGTYEGIGKGNGGEIKVSVTVKNGKIVEIQITEDHETPGLLDPVIDYTIPEIIKAQTVEGIDTISGATNSSQGVLNAIEVALNQAKK